MTAHSAARSDRGNSGDIAGPGHWDILRSQRWSGHKCRNSFSDNTGPHVRCLQYLFNYSDVECRSGSRSRCRAELLSRSFSCPAGMCCVARTRRRRLSSCSDLQLGDLMYLILTRKRAAAVAKIQTQSSTQITMTERHTIQREKIRRARRAAPWPRALKPVPRTKIGLGRPLQHRYSLRVASRPATLSCSLAWTSTGRWSRRRRPRQGRGWARAARPRRGS